MQFNKEVEEVIRLSREVAIDLGESHISSYHFLLAILKFENTLNTVFRSKELDFQDLINTLQKKRLETIPKNFYLTKELEGTLKISGYYSYTYYGTEITIEHLILAMLADKRSFAGSYLVSKNIKYTYLEYKLRPVRKRILFVNIGQNSLLLKIGFVGFIHKLINS